LAYGEWAEARLRRPWRPGTGLPLSTIFISHSSSDNALASELGRRLEQQNHHSVFLDLDPEKGIVAGQSWEQTLYRKLRACRAVVALCTDHYLNSQWCFAELALARMEGKHIIALQVDPLSESSRLPAILTDKQLIDLRSNAEEGYERLWKGLEAQDLLGVAGEWDPKKPPYLGLIAYQEEHAPVFFGREDEARAGLELLSRGAPGLIMVLGASGSGKSSASAGGDGAAPTERGGSVAGRGPVPSRTGSLHRACRIFRAGLPALRARARRPAGKCGTDPRLPAPRLREQAPALGDLGYPDAKILGHAPSPTRVGWPDGGPTCSLTFACST
jgi:hypothetical protein